MLKVKMYENEAIIFDPNEYQGKEWASDFVRAAIEKCHDFLPYDWYVVNTMEDGRVITVAREKYREMMNLQPYWVFCITADPVDERHNWQWLVFDVFRHNHSEVYSFQIP